MSNITYIYTNITHLALWGSQLILSCDVLVVVVLLSRICKKGKKWTVQDEVMMSKNSISFFFHFELQPPTHRSYPTYHFFSCVGLPCNPALLHNHNIYINISSCASHSICLQRELGAGEAGWLLMSPGALLRFPVPALLVMGDSTGENPHGGGATEMKLATDIVVF